MDSSVSPKDEIWFLRVCHHISNAVYETDHLPAVNAEIGECGELHLHTHVHINDWVLEAQEGHYLCLPGEVARRKGTNEEDKHLAVRYACLSFEQPPESGLALHFCNLKV
jgi:hypothetical protein